MTIHREVEAAEADKMAAAGARILSRYHIGGQVFCDVETANGGNDSNEGGQPPAPPPNVADEAPKKRGRPKKTASKG